MMMLHVANVKDVKDEAKAAFIYGVTNCCCDVYDVYDMISSTQHPLFPPFFLLRERERGRDRQAGKQADRQTDKHQTSSQARW